MLGTLPIIAAEICSVPEMFWPFLMIILAPNSFSLCAVPNIHVKLLNPSLSIIIGREVLKNWTERKHVKTIDKLNYVSVFTNVIESSVYDLCSLSVSFLPRAQIPPSPSPFNACHAGYSPLAMVRYKSVDKNDRQLDVLTLRWYELGKRPIQFYPNCTIIPL